jgi:CheY-like chemotaxis protein
MTTSAILLISDSPDEIVAAQARIVRAGLDRRVVVAHDGAEALRLLRPDDEHPALRPSAILLDLKTPRMNAFDFVIHVRADPTTRDVPIAVLPTVTNGTTAGELLSGEEHPDDSAFPKPRSTQELFTTLQALGVSWLTPDTEETPPVKAARRATRRIRGPRVRAVQGPMPQVRAS